MTTERTKLIIMFNKHCNIVDYCYCRNQFFKSTPNLSSFKERQVTNAQKDKKEPESHFNTLVLEALEFLMVDKNTIEVFDEKVINLDEFLIHAR